MRLIHIENKTNESKSEKKQALFGNAVDLANYFIKAWALRNMQLSLELNKLVIFISNELINKDFKRNFIQDFFHKRKIKRGNKIINQYLHELRHVVLETDALVGFNAYLKTGKKYVIKNKKIFDDLITERREIAIMMQGLLLFMQSEIFSEYEYSNENSIFDKIKSDSTDSCGYFSNACKTLITFTF